MNGQSIVINRDTTRAVAISYLPVPQKADALFEYKREYLRLMCLTRTYRNSPVLSSSSLSSSVPPKKYINNIQSGEMICNPEYAALQFQIE